MSLTFTAAVRANKPKRNVGVISGGSSYSLAIDKNGRAWGWGSNGYGDGRLGDNSTTAKCTPVSVAGAVKTFCQISAGSNNSLAIDKNGRAWGWGYNYYGQIGNNSTTSKLTPVSVLGAVKTFCQISAGDKHSLAIDKNGRAWAWGNNADGQLGDNGSTNHATPVSIVFAVTFCKISARARHSLAIEKNGRAWGWGYNYDGQLGNGNSGVDGGGAAPISVSGGVKTFCHISTGNTHSLAIDKNGRAWGWGSNYQGGVGDNSFTTRLTPVSVAGAVKTFCIISAGGTHSLAIDKNGRAWGWGNNGYGQLGDNSATQRLTPVSMLGAVKTFCQISAGESHSLAIDKNGRAWAWGYGADGQLGDNSTTFRLTPVQICNI